VAHISKADGVKQHGPFDLSTLYQEHADKMGNELGPKTLTDE
jgi:hypothetical protein